MLIAALAKFPLLTTTSGSEQSLWLLTKDHITMLSSDILPMDWLLAHGLFMKQALHKLSSHSLKYKGLILFSLTTDGRENLPVKDSV